MGCSVGFLEGYIDGKEDGCVDDGTFEGNADGFHVGLTQKKIFNLTSTQLLPWVRNSFPPPDPDLRICRYRVVLFLEQSKVEFI